MTARDTTRAGMKKQAPPAAPAISPAIGSLPPISVPRLSEVGSTGLLWYAKAQAARGRLVRPSPTATRPAAPPDRSGSRRRDGPRGREPGRRGRARGTLASRRRLTADAGAEQDRRARGRAEVDRRAVVPPGSRIALAGRYVRRLRADRPVTFTCVCGKPAQENSAIRRFWRRPLHGSRLRALGPRSSG